MAQSPPYAGLGLAEVARRGGAERQAPQHLHIPRHEPATAEYTVSSFMHSSQPAPDTMRVKSGYKGHVPHSRGHVGGSYRTMVNRGVPGKEPCTNARAHLTPDFFLPRDERSHRGNLEFHGVDVDVPETHGGARVPVRVHKILSGEPLRTEGKRNVGRTGDSEWLMTGYTGHVRAAPRARARPAPLL